MMLAIKGHPERGNEVIERLEMLGGINTHNLYGNESYAYYTIDSDKEIKGGIYVFGDEQLCHFTLEQFEEKFPYKVDDCVVNHKYGKGLIIQMLWIDNEIVYEIKFQDCTAYCKVNELCKYNASKGLLLQELTEYLSHTTREELDKTMKEIKIALAPFKVGDKVIVKGYEKMGEDEVIYVFETYEGDIKYKTKNHLDTHYFMEDSLTKVEQSNKEVNYCQVIGNDTSSNGVNTSASSINEGYTEERKYSELRMPLDDDDKLATEITISGNKIVPPDGYLIGKITQVDNGMIVEYVKKQPQYPKSYRECCDTLYRNSRHDECYEACLQGHPMQTFARLLICRDAYWKIAGEQMGLDKPWEPDWEDENEIYYTISYDGVNIKCYNDTNVYSKLAFPTKEMRNAFYEEFKDLIEQCKLL